MEAANEPVFEDFEGTDEGDGVTFETSYGASGDQSRAVVAGADADVVHYSLETDVTRLVDEGLVAEDWKDNATKGIATSSVVVFVVRTGNPEGIETWDDLVKPGVEIITPNPGSSGSARWNILAAWAHITGNGGSEDDAKAFLTKLLNNTIALPGSGREATTAFTDGSGDVLLSYENEAILAKQNGADVDYVLPAGHPAHREPRRRHHRRQRRRQVVPGVHDRPRRSGRLRRSRASGRSSTVSRSATSRVPTTRPTPSRRPTSCGRSTATSTAGPRPPTSTSATARTATRWASSPSSSRRPARWATSNDHRRRTSSKGRTIDAAGPASPEGRRPRRTRRSTPRNTLTRGAGLSLGIAMVWFSLLVLIPLTAVVATAAAGGWSSYFSVLNNPQTWAAVTLTVTQSFLVTAINVVMGTVIAWVLVRDHFPGKALLDVVIDIPFALPTIVAGLILLTLYGPNSPIGFALGLHASRR